MKPPVQCVIDANLLIKIIISEDYSADILNYVSRFGRDVEVAAPTFIFLECANAIRSAILRKGYAAARAVQDIRYLQQLNIKLTSTDILVLPAMAIAAQYGISAYDAVYAALAVRDGLPILTGDTRLLNSLATSGIPCIPLSSVFTANNSGSADL